MKHAIIVPMLLLALCATAQPKATVERGAECKKTTPHYIASGELIGTYQGLNCWLGRTKGERLTLALLDHNLEPMRTMELPKGADMRLLSASIVGNHAHLLLAEEGYRNMTLIFTSKVDLDSMRPAEGTLPLVMADSLGYGKNDVCHVWGASSPNGQRHATVIIVEYKEKKQYAARATLMDATMKVLWSKDYAMGSTDEMAVTDDGTIVTLGFEDDGEMTHFIYNVISERLADSYDATVKCDPIRELHLAGVVDRHAMAVGVFTPQYSDPDENLTGGVVGLSFQIDAAELTGFVLRPFMNEDMNILENKKTKKIQRTQETDYVSVNAYTMTDFGAVIAVGRNYQHTFTEDNGLTGNNYHRVGLHMVAIDTTASIKWVRNVRRNDLQKGEPDLLNISLLRHGGRTLLLKSESPSFPNTYDISKDAKEFKLGSKGNLVLYSIDDEGEVSKLVLENKSHHNLLKTVPSMDGNLLLLTADGKRTRQTKLTID